jgi:MOSC domain-containing protein YiiM
VLLEVTSPRIPCATFQGWLGEAGWLKRFIAARRPGAYLRVIDEGSIRAGDSIEVVVRPEHDVTVALAFRAFTTEPDLLARLAAATALPKEAEPLTGKPTHPALLCPFCPAGFQPGTGRPARGDGGLVRNPTC